MSGLDSPRFVLGVESLREDVASFEEFPFCVPAIRHLERLGLDQAVTFFVGENARGKPGWLFTGVPVPPAAATPDHSLPPLVRRHPQIGEE